MDNNKNTPSASIASSEVSAPHKADPLNAGISEQDASEAGDVIEIDDELGGTGTLIFGGFLASADYNPSWSGINRIKLCDQMRLSDATLKLAMSAVKYPILSTKWYIKPGKGEDDNGPMTSLIREELFQNPNFSFLQFQRQALLSFDYGNMFFEKVWRDRLDGQRGWKKLAPRLPQTILRYTLSDGITPGITQILPTGGNIQIPQWKLLMYILELEGANYEGHSLFRAAHRNYFYKDLYYKIDAIAAQRQGCGFPIIHSPPQANPKDKARAKEIARNLRTSASAFIDLPTGFTLEWIDMKANSSKKLEEMIIHHNRQETVAFMNQFLDLGSSTAGSQAMVQEQTELFYLGLNYLARTFQEPTQLACNELCNLNWSNISPDQYPTLEYAGLGKINFKDFSESLFKLAEGGYVVPTEDDERHIRQLMLMPEAAQFSDEEHQDPATINLPVPKINNNDPSQVQIKKPIRYLNSESASFMKNILEWKEQLEEIIQMKEK